MDYSKYLKIGLKISLDVGKFLQRKIGIIKEITYKQGLHYRIKEDEEANEMYVKFYKKYTPECSIYTEEGERNIGEYTWVIDPIEGTSNYRVGNPFFATQSCLMHNNIPVVAVVHAPLLKQTFVAIKGRGAFLDHTRINITKLTDLKEALIVLGKGTDKKYNIWYPQALSKVLPEVRTIRSFGACGLEMAYTAAGMIDVYVNNGSQFYDYIAGSLLISEAGGITVNSKGKKWNINNNFIIGSNSQLTKEVSIMLK